MVCDTIYQVVSSKQALVSTGYIQGGAFLHHLREYGLSKRITACS